MRQGQLITGLPLTLSSSHLFVVQDDRPVCEIVLSICAKVTM